MKAIISDKIYLSGLDSRFEKMICRDLTFDNPKFFEAQRNGRATYGIDRKLKLYEFVDGSLVVPRGYNMRWLFSCPVVDQRNLHPVAIKSSVKPRDYQERAISSVLKAGGGVLVAPTGSGKTTMGIELASRLGQRCLVLVKSLDLAKQWQDAIKRFTGLECGLIGGGKWVEGEEFTVALVQTLVKHLESLDYGVVIVDECHSVPSQQVYDAINRQTAKYRFGLSATPQRRDNLEMMIFAAIGPIVAEIKQSEVTGAVLPVTITTVSHNFYGSPEGWSNFINIIAADESRNRLLANSAIKSSRVVGTAVLTATVAHAETLAEMLQDYGVLLIHGQLPKRIRNERMANADKSNLIVGTLSLLSEGIDWPHIGAIILAAPVSASVDRETPAATRLIQSIGRGRRPYPGKRRCNVLDIIDNHPLGRSAYRKREAIYRHLGFTVSKRH